MSSDDPTDLIIGSCVVIVGTTIVRNVHDKKAKGETFQPIAFGFLLCLALLAIAFVAPGFAKGLAVMGLVGAFVLNGPVIFSAVKGIS